ncbi:MAG: site-2 protease family protein [Pseudomonadales bacterium]|jgi:Zn-dependent protease|nr:site-2 protease family protein [Pseudomonadales bacterium]
MKLLFLLLKGAKFGKLLSTSGTMLLSVIAYAFIFGWRYAIGFVGLIFVHEMGHYIAARQRGLNVGAPMFIPFVGAWIELKEMPHNVETEAYVGLAGPLAGTLGALACYFFARHFASDLLLALAYSGMFLNLFNLIPLAPFDGGRITAVLSPRIWLLGVPILIAVFFWRPSPMLILITLLAAPQLKKAWHYNPDTEENRAYYAISTEARLTYAAYYLALAGFLAVMMHELHEMLSHVHGA